MAIKQAKINFDNIENAEGIESLMTALENIDGVIDIQLNPSDGVGVVNYEDTETTVHALKAAINTVDYVTQLYPEDAPQNPDN